MKDRDELFNLANRQFGYFTSAQAKDLGYKTNLQTYHVKQGHWLRVVHSVYRLPGFEDSAQSLFTFFSLWSRNRKGETEATISHNSALVHYGAAEAADNHTVDLTVAPGFRKKQPEGCNIHKARLQPENIIDAESYQVTSPLRTIMDCKDQLAGDPAFEKIIADMISHKILQEKDITSHDIMDKATLDQVIARHKQNNANDTNAPPESFDNSVQPQPEDKDAFSIPRTEVKEAMNASAHTKANIVSKEKTSGWNVINDIRSSRRNAAFTLVELLVVIAIISILAAMLMPALQKAMDSARSSACQNNLKQMSMGVMAYAEDFGQYAPCVNTSSSPNPEFSYIKWQDWAYFYIYDYKGAFKQQIAWDMTKPNQPPKGVFSCPAQQAIYYQQYGMNYYMGQYSRIPLSRVKRPSQRCMLGDTTNNGTSLGAWDTAKWDSRHSTGTNFIFADWHVKWIYDTEVPTWNMDYFWYPNE